MLSLPLRSTLFPYTTLFRSLIENEGKLILIDTGIGDKQSEQFFSHYYLSGEATLKSSIEAAGFSLDDVTDVILSDRKSTRLNSSHLVISYAVFCLKKKKRGV